MSRHPSREQYKISKAVEWFKEHNFIATPIIWFVSSFVGLWGVYEGLVNFNIKIFDYISSPFTIFLCFSFIITLLRIIVHLLKNFVVISTSTSSESVDDNDSLIEMMKDAQSHSRWAEIIKIGSALSDVLWFTSRKKLRVAIGHFVEVAATQADDRYTLSATLIEDLGNTVMGLGEVDEGINYIEKGIRIAEDDNYPFLITRGYRNLANCYSFKNDPANASVNLAMAEKAAYSIIEEVKKLEALGAIEYARCKILEKAGKYVDAIDALDKSINYYNELSKKYPETAKRNKDRLVKIHREKGVIYLSMNTKGAVDSAYVSLNEGLRLAQETLNYDNIIRCCSLMAGIQIDRRAIPAAEGMINIAKDCLGKIDTPSIINEYEQIMRKLEFEKHAS